MPKIAEIEHTPNPNAVKFVLKEPLTVGFPRSFPDAKIAETDPLAKALFDVGHVVSVFMQDRYLTITKDDELPWSELLSKLAPPIRQAPGLGTPEEGPQREILAPSCDPDDELLEKVRQVLTVHILPVLAVDGGGLEIIGRQDKQIFIRFQGACIACPGSAMGTMLAMEGILKAEVDPEITVLTV